MIDPNKTTWYFFSTPASPVPSAYYYRFPLMLRHLSQLHIYDFKAWQGTHEAPIPVDFVEYDGGQEEPQ